MSNCLWKKSLSSLIPASIVYKNVNKCSLKLPKFHGCLKFSSFVQPKVQNPKIFQSQSYITKKKQHILQFQRLKLENEEHSLNYFSISALGLLSEKQQWLRCKIKAASWLSFCWWEKSKMPRKPKKKTFFSSSSFLITNTWRRKKSYQELVARSDTRCATQATLAVTSWRGRTAGGGSS